MSNDEIKRGDRVLATKTTCLARRDIGTRRGRVVDVHEMEDGDWVVVDFDSLDFRVWLPAAGVKRVEP